MSGERAPECFQELFKLLESTSKLLLPWCFRRDPAIEISDWKDTKIRCDKVLSSFPVDSWSFLTGIAVADPERIRIWMVCNVNESMAKDLQSRIDRCIRGFVWLERIEQRFSAMDPDKRDESRMARIAIHCCERCFWSFLYLETFIGDLCAAKNWKRGNAASGDGKQLVQQVETKDESSRTVDGLYADERCLIWDGERYERLTRKMVEILEVFVDQFNRGFPVVNLDLIFRRTGKRFDGGFIGQAFKQNRKGSPPLHDVHVVIEKISDGEYRLLPPSENNS